MSIRKRVNGFLMPGAIVHELSHALLCLITGTTIKELNLFSHPIARELSMISPRFHSSSISSLPLQPNVWLCLFHLFISKILSNPIQLNSTFPQEIHFTLKGLFDVIRHLLDAVWITFNTFRNQFRITDIRHIFFLLALVIFTVSMSPHKQDIKHLVLGFGIISAILFFLEKLGIHLLHYKWWNYCIKELWVITTLTISVLATLLFITLIFYGHH